jgi:hypothetical protein
MQARFGDAEAGFFVSVCARLSTIVLDFSASVAYLVYLCCIKLTFFAISRYRRFF